MTTVTHSYLDRTVEKSISLLTINHPPGNTLSQGLLEELDSTLDELAGDEKVKVVVLTGAGRFFIAGADIRVLAGVSSAQKGTELAMSGQAIFNKIENFKKPIIAAINGVCLGGGLELAMCCHIRLAAEGARLGQPEINLGIIPGFGGTQRLTRIVGRALATELILTANPISAQEAKALGLVSMVVPPDDLMRQAMGVAGRIASKPQLAVRAALRAIQKAEGLGLQEGLALEASLFGELCESEDKQEGISAFLEKRQAQFKDC